MEKLILTNYSIEDFQSYIKEAVRKEITDVIERSMEKDLMTRKETTQFFKISMRTLQTWTDQGLVPSMRIGNKIYYSKREVIGAMEKLEAFGIKKRRF